MTMHFSDHLKTLPEITAEEIWRMIERGEVRISGRIIRGEAHRALLDAISRGVLVDVYGCHIEGNLYLDRGQAVPLTDVDELTPARKRSLGEAGIKEVVLVNAPISCYMTHINGSVQAEDVVFQKRISFVGTTILEASFMHSTFVEGPDFWNSTFIHKARFNEASLGDGAYFEGAVFHQGATFQDATFGNRTTFDFADFREEADFQGASFGDATSFSYTKFHRVADFTHATFEGSFSILGHCERRDPKRGVILEDRLPVFSGDTFFCSAKFLAPERVIFQDVDLSKTRFLGARLDRVHFIGNDWDSRDKRKSLYDERTAWEDEYPKIANLYRQLKKNYEEQRAYPEAGDFHYGDMEMTLKQQRKEWKEEAKWWPKCKKWFAWFLTRSYKFLSGYGETPVWALGVAAGIWIIPAAIYFTTALVTYSDYNFTAVLKAFLDSLGESLQAMTFRLPKFQDLHLAKKPFVLLQALLGPIQIALVTLALRRKFRR